MPKINVAGSRPANTEGAKRQVADNIPVLWGTIDKNAPLHLPYVCRFIYAYSPSVEPVENQWAGCDCPSEGNCASTICEWTSVHEILGTKNARNSFDPGVNIYPEVGGIILPGYTGEQMFYTQAEYPSIFVRARHNTPLGVILYEGPMAGCPYYESYHLHRITWTKKCYAKLPEGGPDYTQPKTLDGCMDEVIKLFLDQNLSVANVCERTAKLVNFVSVYTPIPSRWQASWVNFVDDIFSDYTNLYNQGCVPGPGPCE